MAARQLASGHISQESPSGKGQELSSDRRKRVVHWIPWYLEVQGGAAGGQGHERPGLSHFLPSLSFPFCVCCVVLSDHRWASWWDRELGCRQLEATETQLTGPRGKGTPCCHPQSHQEILPLALQGPCVSHNPYESIPTLHCRHMVMPENRACWSPTVRLLSARYLAI